MAKEVIFLVEESPEGGYEARALGHSIYTEAETLEELEKRLRTRFVVILKVLMPFVIFVCFVMLSN